MSDGRDDNEVKSSESQSVSNEKRLRKPTAKGIAMIIERLQKERSVSFKRASKIKAEIVKHLSSLETTSENVINVQQKLRKFEKLCQNAFDFHNVLLNEYSLPKEQKRQETWFQLKRSTNDAFVEEVCKWLKEQGVSSLCDDAKDDDDDDEDNDDDDDDDDDGVDQNDAIVAISDANDGNSEGTRSACQDDIKPEDSVSNVLSKRSSKRSQGSSSASSARLKAKAEKAALMEQAAALQKNINWKNKRRNSEWKESS
ncbi:hypothetical protein QQF64_017331 [Cirrhinus molitorella]|uniref:Uncharacterized protein n=1 Tax=Cirrhinus molitorella TaxID=172907 RepID=A0ABR3LIH1_9TELE